MDFPFFDEPNTATITCKHILDGNKNILFVSHDEDDGMWQFLCGNDNHEEVDARIVALQEVYTIDNTVGILSDMDFGCFAKRESLAKEWSIYKLES